LAALVGAERFLAEIKTTANLQHPHILPLFDSGEADGFLFYVMPYVEGETLRDRIDREKQLPVDEAVRIATAVANALDHAHRHKVIHRDIKPANILLQDGEPVVADFGIALAVGAAGSNRLTETGLSLGTPYYMSPEQATGDQAVGASTDTYALACVLYEMLTGDPPYMGSTAQAVLGRIIAGEPISATKQRPSIPANVDAALRKALEKLPADRFTSAQEFVKALGDEGFRYGEEAAAGAGALVGPWNRLTIAMTTLAALFAVTLGWSLLRPETPPRLARFSSPFEQGQSPTNFMEFTADGSALVYVGPGESGQGSQLWIRRWAALDATPIRGTEGAGTFALSPDGREVAFAAFPGPLRVVALEGGSSQTLVDAISTLADWAPDGTVYFQRNPPALGLVPAIGGGGEAVEILTDLLEGESFHALFTVLPGGKMGVFQVSYATTGEDAEVWAIDLDTRERWYLTVGNTPRYASTGHLLFATSDGVLMAAPIDPGTARLTGPSVQVAEGFAISAPFGVANYAVSESGTLIYMAGGVAVGGGGSIEPVWVTRSGDAVPVDPSWQFTAVGAFGLRISPDGERVAVVQLVDGNDDIFIKQLPDGPLDRLTSDDLRDTSPFWSPDGEFVAYSRAAGSTGFDIWQRRADGTGSPQPVLDDERSLYQGSWSPDGEWMVFRTGTGGDDILSFRPGVDSVAIPLVASPEYSERSPALSPNGRWLAYTSDSTGQREVYVKPFPNVDSTPVPVSLAAGGQNPLWAHSGSELFFIDAEGGLVAAEVEAESAFRVLRRETLFDASGYVLTAGTDSHDIGPDDEQFLMLRAMLTVPGGAGETRFILVENWFEQLRQRMGN